MALTSYGAQGKSIQRTFVAQGSESFPASSPEQAYVSASRSKERVDIYTDDANGLRMAIQRARPKQLATELTPNPQPAPVKHRSRMRRQLDRILLQSRKVANDQLRCYQLSRSHEQHEPHRLATR